MTEHGRKHFRVYLPKIIGGVIALIVLFFFVKMVMHFLDNQQERPQRKIQPVTLVAPPPPPPPPPKVEPPPPEPEMEKVNEPEPEPEAEPEPDEAPARDLGLDADGSAGSDGFGLAARKGGTGLFGGGGSPFNWYGGLIKNQMLNLLSDQEELRRTGFNAIVKVWVKPDGSIDRFELSRGSNNPRIDEIISRTLNKLTRISEPPPPGMEQPVKLRINSRV